MAIEIGTVKVDGRIFNGYLLAMTTERQGRPKKSQKDRRDSILRVCLTGHEHKMVKNAAKKAALDASVWARAVLLTAAQDHGDGPP